MSALWLAALVAAAPTPAFRLAAPGLTCSKISIDDADVFVDYFTQQFAIVSGAQVITKNEISSVLGLESQKQLLGCSESATSCAAELGAALGVNAILTGSIAKTTAGYVINLKVISARDASTISVFSNRAPTDEVLFDYLKTSAQQLARTLKLERHEVAQPQQVEATTLAPTHRSSAWVPVAAVGGVLLIGSAVCFGLAKTSEAALTRGDPAITSREQFSSTSATGRTMQAVSIGLLAGGLAAAATSAVLFAVLKSPDAPMVGLGVLNGGAAVSVGGAF